MTRTNARTRRQHGFTLIQMLVVLGIISILVVALVYANRSAKVRAYNVQALVCAEQIRKAQSVYYVENGNHFGTYAQLDTGMLSRCNLVQVTPVTETATGYEYTVKHALGSATYTPSEADNSVGHQDTSVAASNGSAPSGNSAPSGGSGGAPSGSPAPAPAPAPSGPTPAQQVAAMKDPASTNKLYIDYFMSNTVLDGEMISSIVLNGPTGDVTVPVPATGSDYTGTRYSTVLSGIQAGTYTLKVTSKNACIDINYDAKCVTQIDTLSTRTSSVVLSLTSQDGFDLKATRGDPPVRTNGATSAAARGNVGGFEIYLASNTAHDPTAVCTGLCWETNPSQWTGRLVGGSSTTAIGGNSGVVGYGSGFPRLKPVPADPTKPMDLSMHQIDNSGPRFSPLTYTSIRIDTDQQGLIISQVTATPVTSLSPFY